MRVLIQIPPSFFEVRYNGKQYPGNASGLADGANCQQFCFELLRHFGFQIGNLRSSDLWDDVEWTCKVQTPDIFDLLLFNESNESYGAHAGVYVGKDQILHLSKEVGLPSIFKLNEFFAKPNYSTLVGIKRPIVRNHP